MSVRSVEDLLRFKTTSVSLDDKSVYSPLDPQFQGENYAQQTASPILPLDEFVAEFPRQQREYAGGITRVSNAKADDGNEVAKKRKRLDIDKGGKFTDWKSEEVMSCLFWCW